MPEISSRAIVDKNAELAPDVQVGPFSWIGPGVRIGPGCVIGNNATITGKTVLGAKTRVFPLAVVGSSAGASGDEGECIIGEANVIREHTTICAGDGAATSIGNDNLIMISCQVGPSVQIGHHGIFANFTQICAAARVEDYVRTSAFTLVGPGARVGAYTFTTGYVNVDHDAPPYAMLQGSPFRVRGVNTHNLRRCGFGEEDIRALKSVFRELFNGSGPHVSDEALARIESQTGGNPHVARLIESLRCGPSQCTGDGDA